MNLQMTRVELLGRAQGLVPALLGASICWIILIWSMGKGYDFTDDAHYLVWISNPHAYDWSVSEFGFLWNPIYRLVGGDIKIFRLAGAVILSGNAAIFGWALSGTVAPLLRRHDRLTFVLAISTTSLWQFAYWIPTPGYNELNLCGLLLFSAGLAFAVPAAGLPSSERASKLPTVAKAALTGFGWCIVAFAKPPTAILAFFIGVAWVILLRPQRPILFIFSAALFACAFALAGIWAIDGEIQRFIQRKIMGLHMLGVHSPTHGANAMWRAAIDPFVDLWSQRKRLSIIVAVIASLLAVLLRLDGRRTWTANLLTLPVAIALSVKVETWRAEGPLTETYFASLVVPALLLIALVLALALSGWRTEERRRSVAMACLLALLPTTYSLGSGSLLIYHAGQASIFLLSAFIVLATTAPANQRAQVFAATVTLSSFVTVALLVGALA